MNVYIIRLRGITGRPLKLVKVGLANDVAHRLAQICTATPFSADAAHTFRFASRTLAQRVERETHAILADHRLNGEWFRVTPAEAVRAVERAVTSLDCTIHVRDGVRLTRAPNAPLLSPAERDAFLSRMRDQNERESETQHKAQHIPANA
ncbi:GIY-YIG nuclease family protein [Methylorubrum extorquens]